MCLPFDTPRTGPLPDFHRCQVRGMNHLIDNGMAFYWGTSEWNAQQLTEAALIARELGLVGPICDQLQCELRAATSRACGFAVA